MNPSEFPTRCWAEIDLAALRHNVGVVRACAGEDVAVMAVVKADAYGHGMLPIARELHTGAGLEWFGVANVAEAARLLAHLPGATVTILSPALPDERAAVVRCGAVPWISTLAEARDYARLAEAQRGRGSAPFAVEINADTGMGRDGVLADDLAALLQAVEALPALRLAGVATHLPSPDEDEVFTRAQLARFEGLLAAAGTAAGAHAQNSAGLLGYPMVSGGRGVRPGLMLYGSSPLPAWQAHLQPVLTLCTRVSLVRDLPAGYGISYGRTFVTPRPMRVGTLAMGYGDGYPRHLSNAGAEVLVRGRRCAVLGRVTMDQTMIALDGLPEVEPGEQAVLIGRQGGEEILAAELAAKSGTIAWEIFTGLTARVTRCYRGGS